RSDASEVVVWQLAGRSEVILPEDAAAHIEVRVLAGRIGGSGEDTHRSDDHRYEVGVLLQRSLTFEPDGATARNDRRDTTEKPNPADTDGTARIADAADTSEPTQGSTYLLGGDVTFTSAGTRS